MPKLRLVSFDLCPYVQRSAIALAEKGVDYDLEYIDLADKPKWFLDISPHGRVPVLQVDDTVLFESTVILEYLDETVAPRLHPADPLQKARDRAWFSVADALATDAYHMMIAKDHASLVELAARARTSLAKLEPQVQGPLWRGDSMCAMDAIAYPALQRLRWLEELYPELAIFRDFTKVSTWERTLAARPSVRASTVPDIQERFRRALAAYGPVHADVR